MDIEDLKDRARGQWINILRSAGLSREVLDGRGHPCPLCGGRDRFAAFPDVADRGAVHCRHCFTSGTSPSPSDGLATLCWLLDLDVKSAYRWLADCLGVARFSRPRMPPRLVRSIKASAEPNRNDSFETLARQCHEAMSPTLLERVAGQLNLPTEALMRLRVGWCSERRVTTWPMVSAEGSVVGIRLRDLESSRKWAVRGGRAGLFVPDGLSPNVEQLYVSEGPTDTAAMLSVGLPAFGRASASGAGIVEAKFIGRLGPVECVVVADRDEVGLRAAESLQVALLTRCRSVRIICPPEPFGDVREWLAAGATLADINSAVSEARPRTLTIRSQVAR